MNFPFFFPDLFALRLGGFARDFPIRCVYTTRGIRDTRRMSEPIISVSGLRGIVGESLTPEVACRFVGAFMSLLPPGPIVVTRDGRESGPMFATAIGEAVTAAGRTCLYGDVA